MIDNLIQIERNFWENHVLARNIPDSDGSKVADKVIAEYYKDSVSEVISLIGFNDKLQRRQEVVELIKKLEIEKKQIEQEVKLYMGKAEQAENESFRVSWKPVSKNELDTKRLKEEVPEIYEKYKKKTQIRRLYVKVA